MTVMCDVYRSEKRENLYLYVPHESVLEELPDALMQMFGDATLTMTIELYPERRLAKEDPVQVLANLEEHGYHLQLPPVT